MLTNNKLESVYDDVKDGMTKGYLFLIFHRDLFRY
jgi:hypothetical protein